MIGMRLGEAAAALGLRAAGEDVAFHGVSTDSRTTSNGALFVAVRGPRFDGHDFVGGARQRGAVAALVGTCAGRFDPVHSRARFGAGARGARRGVEESLLRSSSGGGSPAATARLRSRKWSPRFFGPWVRFPRPAAISTTRLESRLRCAISMPGIAPRWSSSARIIVAKSPRSPLSFGPRSESSPSVRRRI